MPITASRYHDFSCGHRVTGHESKCRHLHGHNYRVTFHCSIPDGGLDALGRVIDFSVIKARLCDWLEENWDHRFLIWSQDPLAAKLAALDENGTVEVPFNPTAENMALHLLNVVGPAALGGTGVALARVVVEETRKCSAEAAL